MEQPNILDSDKELSYEETLEQTRQMAESLRTGSDAEGNQTQVEETVQQEPISNNQEANIEPTQNVDNSEERKVLTTLKDRDIEIPIYNMDELVQLAHKGLNYTRKTQDIAPERKIIKYARENGLDSSKLEEYMPILVDIEKGNKDAITKLAQLKNIDIYELEEEHSYNPNTVDFSEPSEAEYVAQEIMQNKELANEVQRMAVHLPYDVKTFLGSDANALRFFAEDVQNGIAQKLIPEAKRLNELYGVPFMDAYVQAGNMVFGNNGANNNVAQQNQRNTIPNVNVDARNKAIVNKSANTSTSNDDLDLWEDGLTSNDLISRIKSVASKYR